MCRSIEEMFNDAEKRKTIEIAKQLISLGKNTIDDISECTGLSIEEVTKLEAEFGGKN